MALAVPVLFTLVFGVVDFGWAFGQHLDTRHGAREGARLAAVNWSAGGSGATQSDELVEEICRRMELADGATVSIALPGGTAIGDDVTVTVTLPLRSITRMFAPVLDGRTARSTVTSRLEQPATFSPVSGAACP